MLDLFPPILHGTLREHYLLLFGAAGVFALVAGSVGAWIGARRAARRAIEEAHRASLQLAESRHQALAQSIEAIAIEVERISEAQRFAARLLTERPHLPPPAQRRDAGIVTPH